MNKSSARFTQPDVGLISSGDPDYPNRLRVTVSTSVFRWDFMFALIGDWEKCSASQTLTKYFSPRDVKSRRPESKSKKTFIFPQTRWVDHFLFEFRNGSQNNSRLTGMLISMFTMIYTFKHLNSSLNVYGGFARVGVLDLCGAHRHVYILCIRASS